MSNETAASGATATVDDGVSASPDSGQNSEAKTEIQTKTVSWDNHQRSLDDMHKFKKRTAELEQKLGNIESERLKEKEDWKALAELEKNRADKAEADYKNTVSTIVNTQRLSEIKTVAIQSGLRKEAIADLELLDTSEVQVEATSSNRFLVHGATEYVERLKNQKPHWFAKDNPPNINSGGGGVPPTNDGVITPTDVYAAEIKMKRGLISDGDYKTFFNKYLSQQQKPNIT